MFSLVTSDFFGLHGTLNQPNNSPRTPFHTEIGYNSIRIFNQFWAGWGNIESTPGVYNFEYVKDIITRAKAAGIRNVLFSIRDLPDDLTATSPTLNTRYLAFLTALAEEMDDVGGVDLQLWNEPDGGFWSGTVGQFATMITGAVALWKSITNKLVIGPCVTASGASWHQQLIDTGTLVGVDAYAINCYVAPSEPETILSQIIDLNSQARRDGVELWNTEITAQSFRNTPGGAVSSYPTMMSSAKGSGYVWRFFLAMLRAGVERCYWFGPDEDFATNVEYGTIAWLTDADRETLLDPALAAKSFISLASGAKFSDWTLTGTLRSVKFRTYNKSGLILWRGDTLTGDENLSSYSSGIDVLGQPISLSASYNVTDSPIVVFD